MKRRTTIARLGLCLIAGATASSVLGQNAPAASEPVVLTLQVSTRDAPEVAPISHGKMRQNAWIDSTLIGPGPTEGQDAIYFFTSIVREEGMQGETPVFAFLDLADGKMTAIYPGSKIRVRESKPALDLDAASTQKDWAPPMQGPSSDMTTSWVWDRVISGAPASSNSIFLATDAGKRAKPMLLRFLPRENLLEELTPLPSPAVGLAMTDGGLWLLTRDGDLLTYDPLSGVEKRGKLPGVKVPLIGLYQDESSVLYTRPEKYPFHILALDRSGRSVRVTPLLTDKQIESVVMHEGTPGPWCELTVKDGEHWHTEYVRLNGGQATVLPDKPDDSAGAKKRGYEIAIDYNREPLEIAIRRGAADWKRYPIVFDRTGRDRIKTLCAGPDGRYLYGAGWPVAWIWRFDPQTGQFTILGRHYVFYEVLPWKDELWVAGYWGIKLLRWRPEEPWTFDYDRHYFNKSFPAGASPWGDKGVSNPRLVCKFRYLKKLNLRRPGGMTIGPDGLAYVGGRTPGVESFSSRFGGAINWYDPATETIGQIRDPFLHHSVRDVCNAGDRYIAAAASAYICMYEPLPPDFSEGKFVLYDTVTRQVVLDVSPLDAALSYAEEGAPGRVVVAGASAGKYAGDGIRSAFFIFDVAQMRVTHVIRLPVKARWAEYNVLPFKKGPDNRIYFYGTDDDGTALFRIDSVSGQVDPVLRAKGITDTAVYNNPGAAFAFLKDRVYFGVEELLSLPIETVTGAK